MSSALKNIGVVASATLGSRVLGLVRESLTAAVFGTSALASAYTTAFQLPNLFRRLLAEGGMTAAFVPTLTEELERGKRDAAFTLVSQVASWLFVASVALVAIAMVGLSQAEWIRSAGAGLGADTDTQERWLLAARLAVILFPYLVFVCLAAVFSGALQTLNRFLEPALSPIWLNLSMIGLLLAGVRWSGGGDFGRMQWFCAGVLLGGFLQMAVPGWALMRQGWKPCLDLSWSEPVRQIARLMAPTVLGSSVYLVNMVASRFIGLSLNDAAVSVLNYATRLMELPIGVFAVAVSTVVFPQITRFAAMGDREAMADSYRKGMRLILLINIPAAVGLAVLAEPIIRLFFEHGAFTAGDTLMMLPILAVFAAGLPFLSFVSLVLRAFYAQKDTATPVRAAVLSFVVNVALSLLLMRPLGTVGLAIASNLAVVAQAWYLQVQLARSDPRFAARHLIGDLARIVAAAILMGGVVFAGWRLWRGAADPGAISDAGAVTTLIAIGAVLYFGLVFAFRVEGRDELASAAGRLAGRLGIRRAGRPSGS